MRRFLAILCLILSPAATPAAADDKPLPSFEAVTRIVERHFAAQPRFERTDLITRGDVEPIIDQLIELGWNPGDAEEVYDAFLPDGSALTLYLRSEAGRRFTAQVGKLPGIYDRLERISWLSDGPQRLRLLLADPKRAEIAQRWTTPAGAAEMQAKIAADPRGGNFALPTGHVHTVDELLSHLRKSHAAALRRRGNSVN